MHTYWRWNLLYMNLVFWFDFRVLSVTPYPLFCIPSASPKTLLPLPTNNEPKSPSPLNLVFPNQPTNPTIDTPILKYRVQMHSSFLEFLTSPLVLFIHLLSNMAGHTNKRNLPSFRGLKGAWKHIRTLDSKLKRNRTPVLSEMVRSLAQPFLVPLLKHNDFMFFHRLVIPLCSYLFFQFRSQLVYKIEWPIFLAWSEENFS